MTSLSPKVTARNVRREGEPVAQTEPTVPDSSVCAETDLLAHVADLLAERGAEYGPPSDHHTRTATAVNAILGLGIDARQVALIFAVDKMVRMRTSPDKEDHYGDGCGYLSIAWGHQSRGA